MTAAYRMRGLGWFATCVVVVLGFYLVSLQVASERKKLTDMDARVRTAQRDIRALETEFDTRANLAQLEKWNGDTLSLAAPTAAQFVVDEAQLARIDVHAPPTPSVGGAQVQTAALVVPSAPVAYMPAVIPPAVPRAVAVAVTAAAAVRVATAAPARAAPALAVVHVVGPVHAAASSRKSEATQRMASAKRVERPILRDKPQAVAMLDRDLLSDRTLGDILSRARIEAGKRR